MRNGDPSKVGYVASGFWGGLTLGRLVLADISHRLGERRMVFAYIILALIAQLIFTLVPNIIANAVMISLLGFFLGPLFPTVLPLPFVSPLRLADENRVSLWRPRSFLENYILHQLVSVYDPPLIFCMC